MRLTRAAYLWPGLPQLWCAGHWYGLILAILAAVPINLLILSTLVWTEWLSWTTRLTLWVVLALCWGAGAGLARSSRRQQLALQSDGGAEDLFALAQIEYLKGNWFEAEHVVNKLLRRNARDVDAHLMLATLYRHTGRLEEGATQLRRLALFDDAQKWSMEIERECQLLESAREDEAGKESAADEERSDDGSPELPADKVQTAAKSIEPIRFTRAA